MKMKKCFKVVFIFIKNCINCNTGQGVKECILTSAWNFDKISSFFAMNEHLKKKNKSPKIIPYKLIIFLYSFILRSYSQGSTEYCYN